MCPEAEPPGAAHHNGWGAISRNPYNRHVTSGESPEGEVRRQVWPWLLLLAVLALALQGLRPLWEPDEGRYAAVALRMLRSGDWLTPTLHHEVVHFTKPPLLYWLMAAACAVLGPSEWAFRLPAAFAYAGTVLLVTRIARRLVPGRELLAGLVQATSLLPFLAASLVTTDSLLAFWETLAIASYVELRWGDGGRRARWLFWLALAAGFLTKGPPGLMPVAAIAVWRLWQGFSGGAPVMRSRLFQPDAIAAGLFVALAWFALEALRHPNLPVYWLRDEVAGRLASAEQGRNPGLRGLFVAFLPVILLGAQPWLTTALLRGSRPMEPRPAGSGRFLASWLIAPAVIFTLAQSRLPLYLVPLAPPASLLIARRLRPWGRRGWLALALWAVALLAIRSGGAAVPGAADGKVFARRLAAVLPQPPGELVFVDSRPHYSLVVYLGSEVEWIRIHPPDHDFEHTYAPLYDSLADELVEKEPHRYYLVPTAKVEPFVRALDERGYAARPLGAVEGFSVFDDPRRFPPHG